MTDAPDPADKTQAAIDRGLRAQRTLDDPVLRSAHDELKADLHLQWELCQATPIRENIWQQINGMNAARGQLYVWVSEGQAAQARFDAAAAKQERDAARPRGLRLIGA
jgi:hypothetical protein